MEELEHHKKAFEFYYSLGEKRTYKAVSKHFGFSLQSVKLALPINAEPTTKRIRSKPVPGQPPANVEYSRRKDEPFHRTLLVSALLKANGKPQKSRVVTL